MSDTPGDPSQDLHHNHGRGDNVPFGDVRFDDNSEYGTSQVSIALTGTKDGQPVTVLETHNTTNAKTLPVHFFSVASPNHLSVFNVHTLTATVNVFINPGHTEQAQLPANWNAESGTQCLIGGTLGIQGLDIVEYHPTVQ